MRDTIICVVYDGIDNPVFESQVIIPLQKRLEKNSAPQAIVVTFETQEPTIEVVAACSQKYPNIRLIVLKKYFFVGTWSLYPALNQLRLFLSSFECYTLVARGPFAGYLCLHALSYKRCKQLIIQVRGLVTAEYEYQHNLHKNFGIRTWLHRLRKHQFKLLEQTVFSQQTVRTFPLVIFEAVSSALADHLMDQYGIPNSSIIHAHIDVPAPSIPAKREEWRKEVRKQLGIQEITTVFCYNGSLKPWQCPQETIMRFKEEMAQNSNIFLLILTQDVEGFNNIIKKHAINASKYHVLNVPYQSVERYLAACDIGLLFREEHLMNWVSRPTKALEYKAAGLKIIHNNTIAALCYKQIEN